MMSNGQHTMKQSLSLLLIVLLLFAAFAGCVGCSIQPTQPAPMPPAPDSSEPKKPAPAPAIKVHLLLFTQPGCAPCLALKLMLRDPAVRDMMIHFELEEVRPPDKRFQEYRVTATPALIALTAEGPKTFPVGGTLGQLANWLDDMARSLQPEPFAPKPRDIPRIPNVPAPPPLPKREPKQAKEAGGPGGGVGPGGVEVAVDLPPELRLKNTGGMGPRGPGSGAGLCVFTSIEMAARWAGERRLVGLQKKMTHEPGGGYPAKVDKMIEKYGRGSQYVQYEGRDPAILELMLRTGRLPSITYDGHDARLGGHYAMPIAHMTNLAFLGTEWAAVLDNNFPKEYLWLPRKEFLSRWTGRANGWAVGLCAPRPPAPPHSAK